MAPMTVAPPGRVRVALGTGRWCPETVTVVYIGQSALVWADAADPRRVVAVTSRGRGLVPGGVCVPDTASFQALRRAVLGVGPATPDRPGLTGAHGGDRAPGGSPGPVLDLSGWSRLPSSAVERVDLTLPPRTVSPSALAAFRAALDATAVTSAPPGSRPVPDPAPLRALAAPLAAAALAGNGDLVAALSLRLVGAGPGATPTGDDTIVGALAALRTAAHALGSAGPTAAALLADRVRPLLGRTTAPSAHDVDAALDGRFAERVHALATATTDVALVPAAVASARAWGATSGIDLATAICAGLTTAQEYWRRPSAHGLPTRASTAPTSPTHRRSA